MSMDNLKKGEKLICANTEIYATEEFDWKLTDEGYFIVKLLDYVLVSLNDRGVQRLMRDIENAQWAIAMKGLSIDAQNVIYNNSTKRMAVMIREDMEFRGPVSTKEVAETAQEIMQIVVNLMSLGEIPDNEYQIVSRMTEIFKIDECKINFEEEKKIESELEKLFKQYKTVKNRIIK